MMWPLWFTRRGAGVPHVPVPVSMPSSPPAPGRPATALEFASDLSKNFPQALTFVFLVGSLLVILAACIAGDCFAVMVAAKELKGIPATTTFSIGLSSASVVTLVSTLVARWIRNHSKGAGPSGTTGPPSGTNT